MTLKSLKRRRSTEVIVPRTWLEQMRAQMEQVAERTGPMAEEARKMAASRLVDARSWAAPRLDRAAHSVERDLAPKISAILSDTAKRIDPGPAKSRKWPLMLLIGGITLGIVGAMMYRKNAQRWTDTMKETASDASRWMSEKAERSEETVTEKTDTIGSPSESDVSRRTP